MRNINPIKSSNVPDYDFNSLSEFNLGQADGEKDDNLKASLIITRSIKKLLNKKYNYVLSPKGAGKSAIFKSISNKYFPKEIFDYDKYDILPINKAFEANNKYLSTDNFKEDLNYKEYAVSWALFIAHKLIKKILNEHKNSVHITDFQSKIKKFTELKNTFELYNIFDNISKLNLSLKFVVSGIDCTFNPSISKTTIEKEISLNEIYEIINDFYKKNNLTAKILIDKIDNFVEKEQYLIQKNYIQGLVDAVEEISGLSNIQPLIFLRTDLFFSHSIRFEFDKVADRIIELEWKKDEILHFIVKRLFSNKYIEKNYSNYIQHCLIEELTSEKKTKDNFFTKIFKLINNKKEKFELDKNLNYKVSERFIKLFFPPIINHLNSSFKSESIDFSEWIFTHFIDMNKFINPRLILRFLQIISEKQLEIYELHNIHDTHLVKVQEQEGYLTFNLFMQDVISSTYNQVQNEQLLTVFKLQNSKNLQALYRKINEITLLRDKFKYGDIKIKEYEIKKEEYHVFIEYLSLLGYWNESANKVYSIPPLYRKRLELNAIKV